MSDWTTQFSLPVGLPDEDVLDTVVGAHGVAVTSWLLRRAAEPIGRTGDGLLGLLEEWRDQQRPSRAAWDLSFGRAHLALKENRTELVDVAVRIGLRISAGGDGGRWSAPLSAATTVVVGDRVVERVTRVEADGSGPLVRISLEVTGGDRVELRRERGDGERWAGDGGTRLESVGSHRPLYLLPGSALPPDEEGGEIFRECRPVATITREVSDSFRDAVALVDRSAPRYLPWVEQVLRGVLVCAHEAEFRLVSGSWEDVPGFVHMSSPHLDVEIAEILVHESAHQYFYMLQRVGPIDDGTDPTLYWSPPTRKHRPLSRVLMAYHALANVQLLYDAVRARGDLEPLGREYVRLNEPILREAIRALDEPLRGNRALTRFGRGIYEPLADQMAALAVTPAR